MIMEIINLAAAIIMGLFAYDNYLKRNYSLAGLDALCAVIWFINFLVRVFTY